ncbi:MAG: hypothetical protein IT337_11985, partial [Thermomicrobiales bacterium]|nr:hypothetical protein [Thermomicrobiales bacterium]
METPQMPREPLGAPPPGDLVVGETSGFAPRSVIAQAPGTLVGENVLTGRNRIQWGPIVGGIVSALTVFLLLTVLGIALGASVLEPGGETGQAIGTWAVVWGAVSIIVAFFIGGWVASSSASVGGSYAGLMNGLIAGAAGLLLVVWLTASGLGNMFGVLGSSVGGILNVAAAAVPAANVTPGEAQNAVTNATGVDVSNPQVVATEAANAAQQAANQASQTLAQANNPQTFETVRNSSFVTFLGFLLPL